jgi:hypothetical protein
VVVLGIVPESRCIYRRDYFLALGGKMLLLHLLRYTSSDRLLLWCVEENRRTVFYVDKGYIKNERGRGL